MNRVNNPFQNPCCFGSTRSFAPSPFTSCTIRHKCNSGCHPERSEGSAFASRRGTIHPVPTRSGSCPLFAFSNLAFLVFLSPGPLFAFSNFLHYVVPCSGGSLDPLFSFPISISTRPFFGVGALAPTY